MKIALVAAFCIVALCAISQNVSAKVAKHHKLTNDELAQVLSKRFNTKLTKRNGQTTLISLGSILPDIPDPINIGDLEFEFGPGSFAGKVSITGAVLKGGSNVKDNLDLDLEIDPKITLTVDISSLRLEGGIVAEVLLALDPPIELKLTADGAFYVELQNFQATLRLTLEIIEVDVPGYFEVLGADLNWKLETLLMHADNTVGNGADVNWPEFTPVVRGVIDNLWADKKAEVDELVKTVLGQVTEGCVVLELAGGDTSCINFPIDFGGSDSAPSESEYLVYSENITSFGDWGELERCPSGSYAQGFQVRTEGNQYGLDDTSMNGLRLYCGSDPSSTFIKSREGEFGDWGRIEFCGSDAYISGFQLRSENGGQTDDTAANNFRAYCSDSSLIAKQGDGLFYGKWRKILKCADGYGVCGLKTQVEGSVGIFEDDTALNNVALLCCRR